MLNMVQSMILFGQNPGTTTFEQAIDLTGHGKFNYIVLLTCGLVLLYTYSESLGIGYMIPAAQCDLHLTVNQKGLVNASTFIGIVATAVIWGYLSDNYGRRKVMLPTLAANVLTSFASSLSREFMDLLLLRILTGCMVSASSATVFAYLGEMTSNPYRAKFMAMGSVFISIALIELPTFAWLIIAQNLKFDIGSFTIGSWRIFMWSWYIPGLAAVIILLFLPESPRFLMANYGPEFALPVLQKMYAWNTNKRIDEYPVKQINASPSATVYQHGLKVAWINLGHMFKPPLLRCMIISHITMFMAFLMASGLYTWMPEILNETLDHVTCECSICTIMENKYARESCVIVRETPLHPLLYPVTICMGVISAIGYVLVGLYVSKYGKRNIYWMLVFSGTTMLCTSGLLPIPQVAVGFYITGLILGIAPSVLAAISVEVFPTCVRALALCTLYMMGRLGAAVGAMILGYGIPKHCQIVFIVCNMSIAASGFLFFLWPNPEEVRRKMEEKGFVY